MYSVKIIEKSKSDKLYQWDTERYISLTAPESVRIDAVDFAHEGDQRAIRRNVSEENGVLTAKIPNTLLQSCKKIRVWLMCGEQTMFGDVLAVRPKAKPPGYILPDDEDEVMSYTSLEKRIADLEKNISCAGATGKSAYQYAKDGGYTGTEEEFAQKLAEEIGGVEITDGEPTKASTVMTLNPNAEEVQLYTAPEIDDMFDAFINAEEVSY